MDDPQGVTAGAEAPEGEAAMGAEETNERPLVTFALFAYNQEKYIREAVEGAFSQTYEPLEIILSDDCSTDRTFEIMQEMAAAYKGPHRVRVRRSVENRGLGLHINQVVEESFGEFVVVAAGDDVSLPERTIVSVSTMQSDGTQFIASNYNKMQENGRVIQYNIYNDYRDNYIWKLIKVDSLYFANGATAVYRRRFMLDALLSAQSAVRSGSMFNEDILFAAYAAATNQRPSEYTGNGLVNYRLNPGSLSNFVAQRNSIKSEILLIKRELLRSSGRLAILSAVTEICAATNRQELLNREFIEREQRLSQIELAASSTRWWSRLASLRLIENKTEAKIVISRLFGVKTLAVIRLVVQP